MEKQLVLTWVLQLMHLVIHGPSITFKPLKGDVNYSYCLITTQQLPVFMWMLHTTHLEGPFTKYSGQEWLKEQRNPGSGMAGRDVENQSPRLLEFLSLLQTIPPLVIKNRILGLQNDKTLTFSKRGSHLCCCFSQCDTIKWKLKCYKALW